MSISSGDPLDLAPGSIDVATSVAVTSTAQVSLCVASNQVGELFIQNAGDAVLYIGPTGVTSASGIILEPRPPGAMAGGSITIKTAAAIFGRTASGSTDARVLRTVFS